MREREWKILSLPCSWRDCHLKRKQIGSSLCQAACGQLTADVTRPAALLYKHSVVMSYRECVAVRVRWGWFMGSLEDLRCLELILESSWLGAWRPWVVWGKRWGGGGCFSPCPNRAMGARGMVGVGVQSLFTQPVLV